MTNRTLLLVNFISGGGIKQFTRHLLEHLERSGVDFEYRETRSIRELVRLCRHYEDVVFCVNNIRIYVLFLLVKDFSPILILHDHKARVGASRVERLLIACVRLFSDRFRKIILHSEDRRLGGRPNVVVRKMPFHSPEFSAADKVRVLFFGRIEAYKNLPHLVDIAERTRETTEYFIAGSGVLAPELKTRIERLPTVSLLNAYLDERTIRLLFDWCDYLVLPYADVTQTGLVDQAGQFGKPVLLSGIEGFRAYLDQGGCVPLDPHDAQAAALRVAGLPGRNDAAYRDLAAASSRNYQRAIDAWPAYVAALTEPKPSNPKQEQS